MEIKITINVGGNDPIEIRVDVPTDGNCAHKKEQPILSEDAIWFNETCIGWTKHAELNKAFLLQQQDYCNMRLKQSKILFLNEVYDRLGAPRTKRGQVVGWIYNEDNPVEGNIVDFGIFNERNTDFVNGTESVALLDFNVDGNILEYL